MTTRERAEDVLSHLPVAVDLATRRTLADLLTTALAAAERDAAARQRQADAALCRAGERGDLADAIIRNRGKSL